MQSFSCVTEARTASEIQHLVQVLKGGKVMAGQKNFPLLMELGAPGRRAYLLPELDVPSRSVEELIPSEYLRSEPAPLPELSELEVVRHFTNLSRRNHGVDVGFIPWVMHHEVQS